MLLSSINIDFFRNFGSAQFEFDDKCNIFYGENGSGKTSILEAIHYLILGRSFRTHILRRIIKHGADSFSLFGKIHLPSGTISVGINKSTKTGKKIKIAGKEASSILEITKLAPIQLLNHDSYLFLHEGPKIRRQFIDWGLFHVEQSFLDLWRRVERVLNQRNTAIRNRMAPNQIKIWDQEFAQLGVELHDRRSNHIKDLTPITQNILQTLLGDFTIKIQLLPGWNSEYELKTFLDNNLNNDLQSGYTTGGPHRADLKILVNGVPAKDILSRGQQKLLLYGLQISRGKLITQLTDKNCIYLVDDLLAELDLPRSQMLATMLLKLEKSQIFITGLEKKELLNLFSDSSNKKIFKVAGYQNLAPAP